jgi:hypothetical protein
MVQKLFQAQRRYAIAPQVAVKDGCSIKVWGLHNPMLASGALELALKCEVGLDWVGGVSEVAAPQLHSLTLLLL